MPFHNFLPPRDLSMLCNSLGISLLSGDWRIWMYTSPVLSVLTMNLIQHRLNPVVGLLFISVGVGSDPIGGPKPKLQMLNTHEL